MFLELSALSLGRLGRIAMLLFALVLAGCESSEERVQEHHESGLELVEAGEPEKAKLEFRNALQIDQDFVPARFELAKILLSEGDIRGAVGNLLRVIELEPTHVEARIQLATIMILAQEPEEALKHADVAVRAAPDNMDARVLRASAHLGLGNADQAVTDANAVLAANPSEPRASVVVATARLEAGAPAEALTVIDGALATTPRDPALHMLKLRALEVAEDAEGITAQLGTMAELFPDSVLIQEMQARWAFGNGDMDGVEAALREIRKLEPDNPDALTSLIRFIVQTRGPEAARTALEEEIAAAEAAGRQAATEKMILAEYDWQSGERERAVSALEALVAATEGATADEARLMLARYALSEGDAARAETLIGEILGSDPRNAAALGMRAAMRADAGEIDGAVIDLRTALNENPDDLSLLLVGAQIYQRSGNAPLAGESLAAAVRVSEYDPDVVLRYAGFLELNDRRSAIGPLLEEAVALRPDAPQLIGALAAFKLAENDLGGAEQLAQQLRPIDPETADRIMVAVLTAQGRSNEAVAMLESMAEGAGDAASVAGAIVRVLVSSGQQDEAMAYLDDALAADPGNAEAMRLKAALLVLQGEADAAEAQFEAAIAAAPADSVGYLSLALFQARSGDGEAAMATLGAGIEAAPGDAELLFRRSDLRIAMGDYAGAVADLEALHAQIPDSILIINNLASLISDHFADDPERLARAIEIARPLAGIPNPAVQDTYGWLLHLSGDTAEAMRFLLPAAEGMPENPWVRYHVGVAYAALGQGADARGHLEAALSLAEGQDFPPAEDIRAMLADLPNAN